MQVLERRLSSVSEQEQNQVQEALIDTWVTNLATLSVSELRQPVINAEQFSRLLKEAWRTQKPLAFVAIGCQDWIKPDWGDPKCDRIIGWIKDRKRSKRFAQELADFSRALDTLNIPHQIHFSLSDIEALLHIHLQDMGLTIHNADAEQVVTSNTVQLAALAHEKGARVVPFHHSSVLAAVTQSSSLEELRDRVSGSNESGHFRQFLDALYRFDLAHTSQNFISKDGLGPVWLDIQSFNFSDEVLSVEQAAREVAAEMPLLSLFPNAGNWRAATAPQARFPTKNELIAQLIGVAQVPPTLEHWMRKLHKTRDEVLIEFLSKILNEEITISNGLEKTIAVRLFFKLTFGFDLLEQ